MAELAGILILDRVQNHGTVGNTLVLDQVVAWQTWTVSQVLDAPALFVRPGKVLWAFTPLIQS